MDTRTTMPRASALAVFPFALLFATTASAADAPTPMGAPPPDAKAVVEAPKAPGEVPKMEKPLDGTSVALSAGGLLSTGNSRLLAGTVNGSYESRFHDNGFGASLLGNYGQGAPAGKAIQVSTENLQGRLRYDRYVIDPMSVFLIGTGRHDRFQGLDFRLNVDPGVKYLFVKEQANAFWTELGYDFQYDVRRDEARLVLDANGNAVLDATGSPQLVNKTFTDHSTRLFFGLRHAFNKEVTLATGVEYLQSVVDGTRYRVNFDALFAAKVGGGFALGVGFSARYDHAPLPGKENLDTTTTMNLIYAFSDVPEPPKPPTCPCPTPTPPEPPPAITPPAAAPPPPG
jgi:putative salt-induced outer membrane protein